MAHAEQYAGKTSKFGGTLGFQQGEIQVEKPEQFLKYANDCDQMSTEIPAHAQALKVIADAWRRLAAEAEQKRASVTTHT